MIAALSKSGRSMAPSPPTCGRGKKGKPIVHHFRTLKDYPPDIDEAVAWAKDLKRRGFTFLGPTVVYAHMQAVGMVNDHTVDCFRRFKGRR